MDIATEVTELTRVRSILVAIAITDINREIIEMGAALACPRYDSRYMRFEQADALAAQPRSPYCVKRH